MTKYSPAEKQALLNEAEQYCRERGTRLTDIRRLVLSLVLDYQDVVKAYDLLADLQKIRGNAAPPTVYRALDFLVEMGIVHRTESLNGFVFCADYNHDHTSIITNCRRCGATEEVPADVPLKQLLDFCAGRGFVLESEPIVLAGVCQNCQSKKNEH